MTASSWFITVSMHLYFGVSPGIPFWMLKLISLFLVANRVVRWATDNFCNVVLYLRKLSELTPLLLLWVYRNLLSIWCIVLSHWWPFSSVQQLFWKTISILVFNFSLCICCRNTDDLLGFLFLCDIIHSFYMFGVFYPFRNFWEILHVSLSVILIIIIERQSRKAAIISVPPGASRKSTAFTCDSTDNAVIHHALFSNQFYKIHLNIST